MRSSPLWYIWPLIFLALLLLISDCCASAKRVEPLENGTFIVRKRK